jgi:DNA-binding NarL/FixJ family response regulator
MTTFLIADNHEVVRSGLNTLLAERPDWEVVAEAADGKEAVAQVTKTTPDVAIIEYSLPFLNGVEVTKQIREHSPDTAVLIFTIHDSNFVIRDSIRAGALGYVLKSDAQSLLVTAIDSVAQHKRFFAGPAAEAALRASRTKGGSDGPLSARERSVVQLIAEGHSNKKVASILGLSLKTVETHRQNARDKLGLHSTADLVRYAVRNNLVEA